MLNEEKKISEIMEMGIIHVVPKINLPEEIL